VAEGVRAKMGKVAVRREFQGQVRILLPRVIQEEVAAYLRKARAR
jgi:hypothetical protein